MSEAGQAMGEVGAALLRRIVRGTLPRWLWHDLTTARRLGWRVGGHYILQRLRRRIGLRTTIPSPPPGSITSVLFVCHGNVMRSVGAEAFLKSWVAQSGEPAVRAASAGTDARDGLEAESRVREELVRLGIPPLEHRSRLVTEDIINESDVIVVMDDQNLATLRARFPQARGKTFLLTAIGWRGSGQPPEIADPYGKTDEFVRETLLTIRNHIDRLGTSFLRVRPQGHATPGLAPAPRE